jgi:hypothetical protein
MRFLVHRLLFLAIASGVLAGGAFLTTDAFGARWRDFIILQLAERGIHLEFDRLTLNPFGGLIARNVRWFNDAERRDLVAAVDRVNLDFDYGQLLNQAVDVESLELSEAHVSLPLDPERPNGTTVRVDNLNARIFLRGDVLEVRSATGVMGGIQLAVSGAVKLGALPKTKEEKEKARKSAEKRLAMIREHRMQFQKTIDWLAQFRFERPPELTVEVKGDMDRAEDLHANLAFVAPGLTFEDYICEEFSVEASYDAGLVDLKRVFLKDAIGELTASAHWRSGAQSLKFQLASSADLPRMASTFLKSELLREVVFYEAPHLSLEGEWFLEGEQSEKSRPIHAVGQLQCGRFSTRGEVFDGLAFDVGVSPDGFYFRELELLHKTGSLIAQALVHEDQGIRYRARLEMDPNVFLPFLRLEKTRQAIARFGFSANSSILFEVEGSGETMSFSDCRTHGRGDFRDFNYRGVPMKGLQADVEFFRKIMIFRDLEIQREEGEGRAREVYVDDENDWLRLTGVQTKLDAVAVISCFAPKTAALVAGYRLPNTTEVMLDGTIGWKDNRHNDFVVDFSATGGSGVYRLWDEDYRIASPKGLLKFKQAMLDLDIRGSLFGEFLQATGEVNVSKGSSDYDITVNAGTFPYEVFGEELDFDSMTAKVARKSGDLSFDIGATLMEGAFSLKGSMEAGRATEPYQGELKINGLSFERFAQTYTPDYETQGDLTGHFKFTGVNGDWSQLKGGGAALIVNGNLYAVPLLGPLTPLLGSFLPKPIQGYNVAKEASCTFEVTDGFVVTKDMEVETTVFRIVAGGKADYLHDEIDFTAQARVRGIGGLVFLPVSQLLEYQADGTIGEPKWSPTLLGLNKIGKTSTREAPSMEALREAEEIGANKAVPPETEEPPKRRFRLPFFRGK